MSEDNAFDAAHEPVDAAHEWDPLTTPVWDISEVDEPTLAPPIERFMPTDEDTIIRRRPPLPPDADEIIRGEYTGWVPLIKPGESLEEAKAREAKLETAISQTSSNIDTDVWSPIEVVSADASEFVAPKDLASDSVTGSRDPVVDVRPYRFPTEIVPDPDFVVSPAEALEEARRRIAQMRASLQTNLNRVSESFEHPIFTEPEEVSVPEAPPVVPVEVNIPSAEPVVQSPTFESLFETESPVTQTPMQSAPKPTSPAPEPEFKPVQTQVREEPRVFTQSTQQNSPTVIIDEAADQTHSLELVIMRDEIKDLRDRLDSSQKLIENLMVRLADLAELALRRKD
jgi:hypothetical protein